MTTVNKILFIIITVSTYAILAAAFILSILIYPAYGFMTSYSINEKIDMIGKTVIPETVICVCVILINVNVKKFSKNSLISVIPIILIGLVYKPLFSAVKKIAVIYAVTSLWIYFIPLCMILITADIITKKENDISAVIYIFSTLIFILYILIITAVIYGSYILILMFLYLTAPLAVIVNIINFLNGYKKIYNKITMFLLYSSAFIFVIYNITWSIASKNMVMIYGIAIVLGLSLSFVFMIKDIICNKSEIKK